jgi:hypothetical protein
MNPSECNSFKGDQRGSGQFPGAAKACFLRSHRNPASTHHRDVWPFPGWVRSARMSSQRNGLPSSLGSVRSLPKNTTLPSGLRLMEYSSAVALFGWVSFQIP